MNWLLSMSVVIISALGEFAFIARGGGSRVSEWLLGGVDLAFSVMCKSRFLRVVARGGGLGLNGRGAPPPRLLRHAEYIIYIYIYIYIYNIRDTYYDMIV